MTKRSILPYARQQIDEEDIAAVVDVLRGDFLTTGPAVEAFEAALADVVEARFAIACSSGTAALHLAVLAAGLGPGDVAIVPAMTFVATANAVRFVGAEVVFADVDPQTALMQPEHLAAAIEHVGDGKLRAVLPVQFAGQCAAPAALQALAVEAGAVVIEDAAHALGTRHRSGNADLPIGSARHAAMSCFSFHPVKTVAMGEGGAITTNDAQLAGHLRRLRTHGIERDPSRHTQRSLALDSAGKPNSWYYEMTALGFNYRASDIHCALGLSQLRKLDRNLERRAALVARYDERLKALEPLVRPAGRAADCRPGWHLFVALIDFAALGLDRAAVMAQLRLAGIGSQVHYIPVPFQPYYRDRAGDLALPGAVAWYERALSLPLFAGMQEGDVDRVVDALSAIVEAAGRR